MSISGTLWIIIILCFFALVIFIGKELWRNGKSVWDKFWVRESKENINDFLGISKTTFLATLISLIIIAIAFLTFIETRDQNKETTKANIKNTQILQQISDIFQNYQVR